MLRYQANPSGGSFLKQTFAAHLVEMAEGAENGLVSYTEVANSSPEYHSVGDNCRTRRRHPCPAQSSAKTI
jgi:hypothetical protein